MKIAKRAMTIASCVSLGACSSIGTVNGVELNAPRMGATDAGPQPYCSQNVQQQWICIIGGLAIVGGFAAIALSHHDSNPSAPPAPPPEEM